MKLQVLAGALALSLGATALAPAAARADDRYWRDGRRGGRALVVRAYRDDFRGYRSSRWRYDRPYRYDGYRYGYGYGSRSYRYYDDYCYDDYVYGGYYGGYYSPYRYARRVFVPSYLYRGYRPLLGVRVGGPHFGVWLGW